jgi:hypothetical protein
MMGWVSQNSVDRRSQNSHNSNGDLRENAATLGGQWESTPFFSELSKSNPACAFSHSISLELLNRGLLELIAISVFLDFGRGQMFAIAKQNDADENE